MAARLLPGKDANMPREKSFFAKRLKQLREDTGLTQEQFAKASAISLSAVRHLEQGWREPTYETLVKLAQGLGVSLAAFDQTKPRKKQKG
jgi:transcriptional regulator with XRE-family HTH domain